MSDGVPYNIVPTDAFKELLKVATGNMKFLVSSCETYGATLDVHLERFTVLVWTMLKFNSERMYGLKFLNVLHDGWVNGNGDSITDVSLAFIVHNWNFKHIAILASVMTDGHEPAEVANMTKEISAKQVDFMETMKWMLSDEKDGRSVRSVVTAGCPFPQGKEMRRKFCAVNYYFNTGNRANELPAVQHALSFPERTIYIGVDTRVASLYKLIHSSVLNYNTMTVHFRSEPEPIVFCVMSADERNLAIQIETVSFFMSDIALVEY
ncbi:hypothetical protein PHPALM_12407 [Phytophthora palmivora]|uniref:Uncharacterized protein n=1 Tax=Phytophthora palmivora TaxID=4796 RepID=A0A2P4XZV0_9STRA|nr:hypothetical protein PHPALM_12407 [Phytophthora palmivora]